MIVRKTSSVELLTVVAVCAFLFFYGLGNFGLVGADEPRYAQIAREMLARHDYISPTLNGEAWLEKPVLYYWLAVLSFKTFGATDTAARFPAAALALAMVLVIYFYVRRFRSGAQLDSALIAASCAAVFAFSRGASTDMPLTASFTVAMLGWYAWYETGRRIWLLDFYVCLGLAALAKGPVAPFLAGLVVLLFCTMRRDIKSALQTLWPPGVLLYCAVVLPWFVAVQIRNPQFLYVFIFEHNLARFGSNMFHHSQPFWYYIPVLMLALAPWTVFAISALSEAAHSCWAAWRAAYSGSSDPSTGDPNASAEAEKDFANAFPQFLTMWTLLPIAFFSLSQSNLPGYILPSIPPCAILTADFLWRRRGEALTRSSIVGHGLLVATLVALFLIFPERFIQHLPVPRPTQLITGLLAAATFFGIYLTLRRHGVSILRFVTLTPVILIVGFILRVAAPTIDSYYSARPVARDLEQMRTQGQHVAVYDVRRELHYGLNFYRNQKIDSYNDNEIPSTAHVLVAKTGSLPALSFLLRNRQLLRVGGFSPQHLEYFLVFAQDKKGGTAEVRPSLDPPKSKAGTE